ncbi:uncharacterized protein HD556DRAFT_1307269 [Suillus plorans]|uniref:Uncharacterized protein n=1 Tax=Suillus plorans TaxID=116603 RepID=A0A9P7DIP1_9AGAM|nr:uncharacterized protein HD556DRAFT_1307269 [Suillus plorans]KAG1796057.1 hypothetical protein HD556DRAFT_1307269 [Suillus plorans]
MEMRDGSSPEDPVNRYPVEKCKPIDGIVKKKLGILCTIATLIIRDLTYPTHPLQKVCDPVYMFQDSVPNHKFTFSIQLSSVHRRSSDVDEPCSTDCEQFFQMKELVHSGTQTTGENEESEAKGKLESELCRVKEQLKGSQINVAYLSEQVGTYRYRWLEEYHRAENLEQHMPDEVYIPHLNQIPEDAPSPRDLLPKFLSWDDEGS